MDAPRDELEDTRLYQPDQAVQVFDGQELARGRILRVRYHMDISAQALPGMFWKKHSPWMPAGQRTNDSGRATTKGDSHRQTSA